MLPWCDLERVVRPSDPHTPPPFSDLLGGQPLPLPPPPGAFAPLAGAGCVVEISTGLTEGLTEGPTVHSVGLTEGATKRAHRRGDRRAQWCSNVPVGAGEREGLGQWGTIVSTQVCVCLWHCVLVSRLARIVAVGCSWFSCASS